MYFNQFLCRAFCPPPPPPPSPRGSMVGILRPCMMMSTSPQSSGHTRTNKYVRSCHQTRKKVCTKCGRPPHKWYLVVGCSSPLVRLAEHLTSLRAWCTRCHALRPGIIGTRRCMTTAMDEMSTPPPPASRVAEHHHYHHVPVPHHRYSQVTKVVRVPMGDPYSVSTITFPVMLGGPRHPSHAERLRDNILIQARENQTHAIVR